MGKARVAPIKSVTIPRLELTAALTSDKVGQFLTHELDLGEVQNFYWTDSRIVLGYISNDSRRFHVYVANRIQQIRDKTSPKQWHQVSSSDNPADCASKGLTVNKLLTSKWLSGPDFLWEKEIPSPNSTSEYFVAADDPEMKGKKSVVLACETDENSPPYSILQRLEYFSDWFRAKRAVAHCLNLKRKLRKSKQRDCESVAGSVQVKDTEQAEIVILKLVQEEAFGEELKVLQSLNQTGTFKNEKATVRNKFLKSVSALYRLDPFLDSNGILCAGGRLKRAQISENLKHPVILPKKHHITALVIRHCHEQVHHQGKGLTLNQIRSSGYWIIGCSSGVSYYILKCVSCRKLRSKAQVQKMSNLPIDRTEEAPPFSFCAVDCFGPFYIKEGRKELKRFGVLFTCLCCRAIDIETVVSMSKDSFINALRYFMSVRGPICQLRCDQGTIFVGAKNELYGVLTNLDQRKLRQFLLQRDCDFFEFKFNPPCASHMGGVWERLIRTARNVISALLHDFGSQLDDESLRTVVCETAAIVNSRPLTVDTLCDLSSPEPLTPNNLLTLKSKVILPPPGTFIKEDMYSRKRWRIVQYIANEFWSRWRKEYLQSLQLRQKWTDPCRNLSVNDIVIIKDDNIPRNHWKLGRISEVYLSEDGLVRTVKVDCGESNFVRPVHKLVLLLEKEN